MYGRGGAGRAGGGAGGDGGKGGISLATAGLIIFCLIYFFGDRADATGALASVLSVLKVVSIVAIAGFVVLILSLIGIAIWAAKKEEKRKEEERKQEILHAPLETFGDLETQQLMDKYDGKTTESQPSGKKNGKRVNPYSAKKNMYENEEQMQQGSH